MKSLFLFIIFLPQTLGNVVFTTLTYSVINNTKTEVVDSESVTLTTYSPSHGETDASPNITASGFKIDTNNPGRHKIIAVSRDLKRKGWKFNKKVRIRGAGRYNGVYTIKDIMNKRHRKRIDVLVGSNRKPIKLSNVKVTLLND
jgi:3D (Asp-Asp-Asp) domain-containing protein